MAIGTLNISYLTRYTATKHHSCHHTAVKITLVQISTPQGTVVAGIYPTELPFMCLDNSEALPPVSHRQRSPLRSIWLRSSSGLGDWWRGGWGKCLYVVCSGCDVRWSLQCVYTFLASRAALLSVSNSRVSSSPTPHSSLSTLAMSTVAAT